MIKLCMRTRLQVCVREWRRAGPAARLFELLYTKVSGRTLCPFPVQNRRAKRCDLYLFIAWPQKSFTKLVA